MSRIAVTVKGYPRLSETFIAQEILGLEKRGIRQLIVSLRHPTDPHIHDLNREISSEVLYLPEYLKDDPKRVAAGRRWAEKQPTFEIARALFEKDLARDKTVNRWRRWGQACVLARELPEDITWLHTHYLHTPCSVTRYAAALRDMKWSFSAHAKDIWTSAEWELREKLNDADWGVTCTQINTHYLRGLIKESPEKVELVYHGLDFARFPAAPDRNGKSDDQIRLISVGRAVEKKGYGDLIKALRRLKGDGRWHFHHIGGGALSKKLKKQAVAAGLENRITWHGSKDRSFVIDELARADIFVLPCMIAKSGDRDGLPNVLMEAQAMGLPVIGGNVSAIPEIVDDGANGLLVPPQDPEALSKAISALMDKTDLRQKMGCCGALSVREKFDTAPGLDRLAKKFARYV